MAERKDVEHAATLAPASSTETLAHEVSSADTLALAPATEDGVRIDESLIAVALPDAEQHRYQRLALLGEGGMGKVWLLRDDRIGRRVAQKELQGELSDDASMARFLREARVQGQLEHPAVVPVYDLGRGADGKLFFTMKRIRGVTLADVIDRRAAGDAATLERFSQRRLLTAFSQVCLAIEFAHSRGVIHRDLKPENLMLGDHGEIYVLDWGVARLLRENAELDAEEPPPSSMQDVTSTGLIGTPGYIAPELLQKGGSLGPRSDVFSLGAILFELLVHRPLFGSGTGMQRIARTLEPVDVPALVSEHDREASPELVALCAQATARDPQKRVQSCRALHDAIERWLDGQRDLELRRQLAERHVVEAREALALEGLDARKRALRAAGRALAIKPDDREARALVLSLFATPPSDTPPEVEGHIEAARSRQSRLTARGGAWGMTSMLGFFPVLAMLGVRSWPGVAVFGVTIVVAIAISVAAARRQTRSNALLYAAVVSNNVVFAICAAFYGPLIMVPTMVITNTVSFALHLDRRARAWAVASAIAAVALPVTLQLLGVLPASYIGQDGGLLIVPRWLSLPPTWTILFVTVGTLIAIANGSRAVAQIRDELTTAERSLQIQAWQLQQLLPEEPRDE